MWLDHVKRVRGRTQEIASKFFALGRRKWGNSQRVLKTIYERVVCPMVLYGAEVWGERASDSRVCKQLRAIERPYLRAMTKAYKMAPTAALAVLAGCVPLEVQAGALYNAEREWGVRVRMRHVRVADRPHPARRGLVLESAAVEGENILNIWTDATVREGRGAYSWVVAVPGIGLQRGGGAVRGDVTATEMEGYAIWRGLQEGLRRRGECRDIRLMSDSEQAVGQVCTYNTRWWYINQVQREVETALALGIRIAVIWRRRNSDGIRLANRERGLVLESAAVEGEDRLNIWTDATVRDGRGAYSWIVAVPGIGLQRGGGAVRGDVTATEMEGYAIWRGLQEGLRRRGECRDIRLMSDSEQAVGQVGTYNTRWWYMNQVQREVETALALGIRIAVIWRRRNSDGIRLANRDLRVDGWG
ncbi:hypothetical protein NQ315_000034 [Exocentrus adspersus]|uniref:RNase H type-1 domain-containing protein n=1 Tax=Exocentrus adspersus TaxID=1586481 RepID=A0AAV8VFP9_9CUCU|nr:hypothetical protein NQ315_000034 [Exocentrus adspersus]